MRPDRRPLSDEAQVILRHATVADLKADAAELSKLFTELDERERERLLVLLFGTEA
jgi:type II secretory pathway predicted ATPase ExeA